MRFLEKFDALHTMATEATGLEDFGATDYHEPLRLLLADIDQHAMLNDSGVETTRQTIIGLLIGRLMTQHGLKSTPKASEIPIEQPLVVTGLPRTGTTVLQRLLNADTQWQSLPFWLARMPMPRPPRHTWEKHPVFQQIEVALLEMDETTPDTRKLHPIKADTADECRWSIDQSFWSTTLSATLPTPDYTQWLINSNPLSAYKYHRRVLQMVANGDRRPWLLKDPSHLFALDALLEVFPGARVVYTHRDPTECISSVSKLAWSIRSTAEPTLTRKELGSQMLNFWAAAVDKAEAARSRLDARQFIDIHMEQTRTDPLGTAERIYDYFDIPLPDTTREAWQAAVDSPSKLAHSRNKQTPEQFGLTRERVTKSLSVYSERYEEVLKNSRVSN